MDFDNPKVYGDFFISDGLVMIIPGSRSVFQVGVNGFSWFQVGLYPS